MELMDELIGLHTDRLNMLQMIVRATIVFFAAMVFIRIAGIRVLGKQTAFDTLTMLMLGAILGRSVVTANQPFFPSLAAVLVLMLLFRLTMWATFKSSRLGKFLKGEPVLLIENGELLEENLGKTLLTRKDLVEALHRILHTNDFSVVKKAYLERSGEITILSSLLKNDDLENP